MNRQEAYERRVYRLAHILASPDQAAPLIRQVVWRRLGRGGRELDRLDPAHLDRLVILTARDLPRTRSSTPAQLDGLPEPAARLLRHLHAMPRQPMEAWALSRLDQLELMEASRAMDCSKTATARHLDAADEHLEQALRDDLLEATDGLRSWLDSLEPGPALARARQAARVRRRVRVAAVVGALVVVAVVAAAVLL